MTPKEFIDKGRGNLLDMLIDGYDERHLDNSKPGFKCRIKRAKVLFDLMQRELMLARGMETEYSYESVCRYIEQDHFTTENSNG